MTSTYTSTKIKQGSDVLKKLMFAVALLGLAGQVMAEAIDLSFSDASIWAFDSVGSQVDVTSGVLSFDGNNTSSNHTADLYSKNSYQGGWLSFEYRGTLGSVGGGYVGVIKTVSGSPRWLIGADGVMGSSYMALSGNNGKMLNNGGWQTENIYVGSGHIALAQFFMTPLGQAEFKNLILTPVPEPETSAMLLAGIGLIGCVVRTRKRSAVNS